MPRETEGFKTKSLSLWALLAGFLCVLSLVTFVSVTLAIAVQHYGRVIDYAEGFDLDAAFNLLLFAAIGVVVPGLAFIALLKIEAGRSA